MVLPSLGEVQLAEELAVQVTDPQQAQGAVAGAVVVVLAEEPSLGSAVSSWPSLDPWSLDCYSNKGIWTGPRHKCGRVERARELEGL